MSKSNTVNNGKGDKPRPIKDIDTYNKNFDSIFGKKVKKVLDPQKKK
jgi:hypothetical protein